MPPGATVPDSLGVTACFVIGTEIRFMPGIVIPVKSPSWEGICLKVRCAIVILLNAHLVQLPPIYLDFTHRTQLLLTFVKEASFSSG